jgi:hypothetical protein
VPDTAWPPELTRCGSTSTSGTCALHESGWELLPARRRGE